MAEVSALKTAIQCCRTGCPMAVIGTARHRVSARNLTMYFISQVRDPRSSFTFRISGVTTRSRGVFWIRATLRLSTTSGVSRYRGSLIGQNEFRYSNMPKEGSSPQAAFAYSPCAGCLPRPVAGDPRTGDSLPPRDCTTPRDRLRHRPLAPARCCPSKSIR
jgi:hypothetical protein